MLKAHQKLKNAYSRIQIARLIEVKEIMFKFACTMAHIVYISNFKTQQLPRLVYAIRSRLMEQKV